MPEAIRYASEWMPGVSFTPLTPPVRPGWSRFNPSIVRRIDGSLRVNVRSSNYRIDAHGGYSIDDADGVIRTENSLAPLSEDLVLGPTVAVVAPADVILHRFPVAGYEDLRLFESLRGLGGLATVRDRSPDGVCRIALLEIADDGIVRRELLVDGPMPGRHEKNWIPFSVDGSVLTVVYSWSPVILATIDLDSGRSDFGAPTASPWANARGGGGSGQIGDERLFVVHEAAQLPYGGRSYVHRFVTLARDGTPRRQSPHFSFLGRGIEFAAGLVIDGDSVLVSFGLEDEEAWIARFPTGDLSIRLTEVSVRPETVEVGG